MENTELKLCKDCTFCKKGVGIEYCINPIFPQTLDPVNGTYNKNYCCNLRMHFTAGTSIGLCGTEAKYFQKRVSWWKKLWNK